MGQRILKSNISTLSLPYKLTLMLTYRCNFRCKMCNIWKISPERELTSGELKLFFKKNRSFSWINISGGEIFMREDLFDLIEVILKECRDLYILNFPTNGYFTNEIVNLVQKVLSESSIRLGVTVSVDGLPQLHDAIRGVNGAWERAITTYIRLREFKNKRLTVKIGFTIQPYNLREFPQLYRTLKMKILNFDFSDIHINLFHYAEHYYRISGSYDEKMRLQLLERIKQIEESDSIFKIKKYVDLLDYFYRKTLPYYIKNNVSPVLCQALRASCFIDPNWNLYPCSIWNSKIGNLKDYDYNLSELWNSKLTESLRFNILSGNCPHCWTPCEAYQAILGKSLTWPFRFRGNSRFSSNDFRKCVRSLKSS